MATKQASVQRRHPPRKARGRPPAKDYQEDMRIPATPEALAKAVLRGGAPRRDAPAS